MIITLGILLIVLAIDFLVYRLHIRHKCSKRQRQLFWAAIASNILLPFAAFGMLMFGDSDAGIKIVMWSVFATVFMLLCRLQYYVGLLVDNRSSWSRVGGVLSLLMASILLWAVFIGRQHIRVNEVEIQSEQLPEAFDGFRIAHFSDLHIGTLVNQKKEIDKLIDSIMTQSPDLIIFSGDLVNASCKEMTPEVLTQLKKLTAPYGVFSVTGNHDCGFYLKDSLLTPEENTRRVVELQREIGWQVLLDSSSYIRCGEDSISVTGIAFDDELHQFSHSAHSAKLDFSEIYADIPENSFNITISHLPQIWENIITQNRANLTLSGHVHSMQVNLHLFGRDFSPASLMYDRWSGRYDDEHGQTLYINDGIGYVMFPMRLGADPEITVYTLRR